jgi:hypothetical protein
MFLKPSTERELLSLPPSPLQVKTKELLPVEEIVIDSVPLVPFVPDQEPVAVQALAFVEDQEISTEEPTSLVFKLDVKEVITAASFATTAAPPPPPPPQEDIKKIELIIKMFLY